jgi:hypothetical protein
MHLNKPLVTCCLCATAFILLSGCSGRAAATAENPVEIPRLEKRGNG